MYKRLFISMLALAMGPVSAQQAPGANGLQPITLQPVQTFQPGPDGKISYSYSDLTRSMDPITREYFAQRKDDKDFLEKSVNEAVAAYNRLYTDIFIGKLQALSYQSNTNAMKPIEVADFFEIQKAYRGAREQFLTKLEGIKAIPEGGLPSANLAITENKSQEIAPWRSVKVDGILNTLKARVDELDSQVNQLTFRVQDRAGVQQVVHGLNIDFSKVTLILPEERDKKRLELLNLRKMIIPLQSEQDKYTGYLVKQSKIYYSKFGRDERYRWRNDEDVKAAKGAYDRLAESYWARAYLRMKYGMGLGTIRMKYKKQWFKVDELLTSSEDLVDFGDSTINKSGEYLAVRSQNDIEDVRENIRQNARVADHRSVIGGSSSPLALVTSIWTFVKGEQAFMETAAMVLKMIESDVVQEALVISAGGHEKMVDYYKSVYYATPELKAQARKLECQFDPETIEAIMHDSGNSDFSCNNSGIGAQVNESSTRSFFQKVSQRADDQLQNFQLANSLEEQLNAQTGTSTAQQKLRKGLKGLAD